RGGLERHLLALRRCIRDVVGLATRDPADRDGHGRQPGRDAQRADEAAAQEAPHGRFRRLPTSPRMLSITWIRSARSPAANFFLAGSPLRRWVIFWRNFPVCFIRRLAVLSSPVPHADTAWSTRPLACVSVDWSFARNCPRPFAAVI